MSKSKNSNNVTKAIARPFFAFFLTLLFVLCALSAVARVALSEKYVEGLIFRNSEYCEALEKQIEQKAIDYTIPTGIDTAVTDQIFDVDEISRDVKGYVRSAFTDTSYTPDTSALENRVEARTYAYFEQFGEVSEETEEVITAYAKDIADLYTKALTIAGLNYICKASKIYSRFFPAVIVLLLIGVYLLGRLCVKLQDFPHRGLRYVSYATGGAALLVFAAPFALYQSRFYERINIVYYPLYLLASNYIRDILVYCFVAAGALVLITLLLIAIIAFIKSKLK